MTISNYISDLLYRYECVILPGFGAFLTQRKAAQIIKGAHSFIPPTKSISFNSQLTQNDGLLVNYISKSEKISYEAAFEKLQEYLHFLQSEIESGKKIEIDGVGFFSLTSEEKIQFEPNERANYLTEAFGLSAYKSEAIEREYKLPQEIIPVQNKQVRSLNPYLKYAAIGLVAFGVAGFGGLHFYNNKITEQNIAEQQKAETKLEQEIQHATFFIENPLPAVKLNVVKERGNYHIVAGAFRVKENAEKKVAELKNKGFKAQEIGVNKYGLHQVVYSSYKTHAEALRNLYEVQRNHNSGAWLLILEL